MDKKTKDIFEYMQIHKSITGKDAYREFRTMALAEYIRRIKKEGFSVYGRMEHEVFGDEKVSFKRYSLEPFEEENEQTGMD